ncbi:hypothetical protein [Tenacibaculum aiptasiae]|uniref:hypothetical protein n=1 Tax=Tenacibaculum aiptasiae TaxID=426481 RepID=UPI0023307C3A|nr:hypothetical protein [Tenacibaculum aiptasiae]
MRKTLFIAMSLFLSFAYGQEKENSFTIPKKTWYVNGSVSLSNQSMKNATINSETNLSTYSFSPTIGYTISNNLVLGLGLGYTYNSYESLAPPTSSAVSFKSNFGNFQIFPYIKKYFAVGSKLALSLQGEARYSNGENLIQHINGPGTTDYENYFIGIRPGITFTLNKNFALEANIGSLGYSYSSSTNNFYSYKTTTSRFNLDLSTSNIFFGLAIFI